MTANPSAVGNRTPARTIGLDGAGGLSCVGVAVAHVTGHYSPHTAAANKVGLVGLSLVFFYVLSGFLLFLPHVRGLTQDRSEAALPRTRNFALHRITRILPGYLVIFLLVNFVLQAAYVESPVYQPRGTEDGTGMITDPWQLLANLTLVQTYIPQYVQTGLDPSWSLTLEYAFYLVLPSIAAALFVMRKRTHVRPYRIALISAAAIMLVALVGRASIVLAAVLTAVRSPYATSALGVVCAVMILVIVASLARGEDSMIARWLDLPPFDTWARSHCPSTCGTSP